MTHFLTFPHRLCQIVLIIVGLLTRTTFCGTCTSGTFSRYPNDCTKFMQCSEGKQYVFSCNTGLYWSQDGQYCTDDPSVCGNDSHSTTRPPTRPPTTKHTTPSPSGNSTTPSSTSASCTGDATWYNLGSTACGVTYTDNDMVAAIGFDYWTTVNPNLDPMCQKVVRVTDPMSGKSVVVKIKDKCGGCGHCGIDLSPIAFSQLRDKGVGRFTVKWTFI